MNAKIIELEDKISKMIFKDNGRTVHYEYNKQESEKPEIGKIWTNTINYQVVAHTFNPKNNETFILKVSTGDSYEHCLSQILEYAILIEKNQNSYTVLWIKKGENSKSMQRSYFYCSDIIEVIEKFFANKIKEEYNIFEIKQNPIS